MSFVAATIYWVIVALWLTVLASVIYFYVRNPGAFGGTRLLLTVIAIDTLRNILENTYFGFYFGGRYGLFPTWVVDRLGMPELLIVPKLANLAAGCVVLFLLIFNWLPSAVKEWQDAQRRTRDLELLARMDPLTNIYNRRHFEELASREFARAQRYKRPASILMIDIDYFKRINDTFGHEMGDWIIKMVATSLISIKRDTDMLGRVGGEEFAIILPETSIEAAGGFAERVRNTIHEHSLRIGDSALELTISIGVAELTESLHTVGDLMRVADKALYDAKNRGRNRVVAATQLAEAS
jgi:diguanylate cyclase (GGDEF)-like protein